MNMVAMRLRVLVGAALLIVTAGLAMPCIVNCGDSYSVVNNGTIWTCSGGNVHYQTCKVWCCAGNPGTAYYCGCNDPQLQLINNQPVPCDSGICAQLGLTYPCTDSITCSH